MKGINAKKRRETNLRGITIWRVGRVHSVEICEIFYLKAFLVKLPQNDINSIFT